MISLSTIKVGALLRDPADPKRSMLVLSAADTDYIDIRTFHVFRLITNETFRVYWSSEELASTYKYWEMIACE